MKLFFHAIWLLSVLFISVNSGGVLAIGHNLNEEFLQAIRSGDIRTVQSLLHKGADINADRNDGTTALAWAVFNNDEAMVELLLRSGTDGPDLNAANDNGVTPLHLACLNQNDDMVSTLLQAGAEPNRKKWTGETPLMTCANTGSVNGVLALIENGADINARENNRDQTALMWAAAEGHGDVVRLLIDRGADVHAQSKTIPEPEPYLIPTESVMGQNFPTTTRFRKHHGNFTPLLFAAQSGDIDSVRNLIEAGADINETNGEDGSALVIAAASGHEDLAIFLVEQGADPKVANAWGLTALHYTVQKGVLNMSNWLPTGSDDHGWVHEPLHRLMKILLAAGADPDAPVTHTLPYLDDPLLRVHDNQSQIDIVGSTPLLLAAASGDTESIKIMVDAGADIHAKTMGGGTLFMLAAGGGAEKNGRDEQQAIEAAKYVLSLGDVNINAQLTDNRAVKGPGAGKPDGRSILHFVTTLGWNDMLAFLIEQGADMDIEDRYGMTPLMIAMGDPESRYYRNVGVGRYDDRYRRTRGKTQDAMIELLLASGAKPFTGEVVIKHSLE